jgi:hypothetical protein
LTRYFPIGHHQTPTIAGDVGHGKPRRHAHLTRGELLYRVACSPCFLGHRSFVMSIHRRIPPHMKLAGATPATFSRGRRHLTVYRVALVPSHTQTARREPSSAAVAVD